MSKRNLLIGIVALALLVAALVWFQRKPEEATEQAVAGDPNIVELSAEAQRNANLEVAEVSERPMERMLVATGVVAADQNREAHLRPLSRGVANRALVQLGDRV